MDVRKQFEAYQGEEKGSEEIKELKKLLQNEQLNSEKFRIAYEFSPDAININRYSDGLYVSVNKEFTKIMGYSEEEIIGKTSIEKNIWKNINDRDRLLSELKEKKFVKDLEAEFVGKDGRIITGSMSATIILLENVKHILSITRDITQVRKNEATIEIEKTFIEAIMENMPDHIYFKDLNSRFIKANRSLSRSLGIENPDDLIGKSDFDFFTDEHAAQAYSDEQLIIKTGDVLRKTEKETYSDKSATWVSTIKLPLRDKSGKIIGTFGISRDISKEKTAEDKLMDERMLLLTLINNIPDRIYIKDVNSRFVMCNEAVMKRRGFTDKSQIIGKSDLDLLPKEVASEFVADEQKIIQTGIPLINKEEIRSDYKGFKGWTLSTKVPLYDSEGNIKGIVGIGRDITNRKRKELENSVVGEI